MLELKSSVSSHVLPNKAIYAVTTSISDLPQEILDIVLEYLYRDNQGRLDAILPSSRTNRQFRTSALPLLFESVSCAIRDQERDSVHPSFDKLAFKPHLLQHVKTLFLRKPLAFTVTANFCKNARNRLSDVAILESALKHMPQLQQVRLYCSLATAIDVLRFLESRKGITVIIDRIRCSIPTSSTKDQSDFLRLLQGRTVALGGVYVPQPSPIPGDATEIENINQVAAIDLRSGSPLPGIPVERFIGDSNNSTFPNTLSELRELWFGQLESSNPSISWSRIIQAVPWPQLRRLRVHGPHLQRQLHDIHSQLTRLEDLRLKATNPTVFHANCSYSRHAIYSDVNYPFFDVEFASLPSLKVLEIEGICNHIPMQNLVSPNLRALRLHKPDIRYSVISAESQRSPRDLVIAAEIAPRIERLELDIGYVENLWHPTAIPGVDVDVELYRFISVLSNFKSLRVLRLFPPYVAKEDIQPYCYNIRTDLGFRQPLSDEQAIRMFNRIRSQCPRLEFFSISVSSLRITHAMDFSPMNWEVRPWGNKTIMTTRQLGKDYELKQVWVGDRRLTMETKKHAYSKKHIPDPEGWLLARAHQA